MDHRNDRRTLAIWTLAAAMVMAGCNGAEDIVQPNPLSAEDLAMGAQTGALSGPSGDVSGDMITGMMDLVTAGPQPAITGGVSAAILDPGCPDTFDLPMGISGTCSMDAEGVMTWIFGGTVLIDGDEAAVEGSMTATPSATQPGTGASYDIDFMASASGSRGSATWTATGTVLLSDAAEVVDYDLNMTHTVTPAGGSAAVVQMVVDPATLGMTLTGPMGGAIGIELDRETMTGTMTLNGVQVGTITIVDGCATIQSTIDELPDRTVCAAAA